MLANILNSKATKKIYFAWCFLNKKENTLSGAILFFATVYLVKKGPLAGE